MFTFPFGFLKQKSLLQGATTLRLDGDKVPGFGVSNQFATVPNSENFGIGSSGTVSIRVNLDQLQSSGLAGDRQVFISKKQDGAQRTWDLGIKDDGLLFYFRIFTALGAQEIVSPFMPMIGTFYHVAATWDATDISLYIDAVSVSTATKISKAIPSSALIKIGAEGGSIAGDPLNGSVALPLLYLSDLGQDGIDLLNVTRQPQNYPQGGMQLGFPLNKGVAIDQEGIDIVTGSEILLTNGPIYDGEVLTFDSIEQNIGTQTLLVDGSTQYATVADSASLDLTTGMTLSCYVNMNDLSGGTFKRIISKSDGVNESYNISFDRIAGQFLVEITVGSVQYVARGGPLIVGDQWYHVAGTYDGTDIKLYVDTQLVDTSTLIGSIDVTSVAVGIGSDAGGNRYLSGSLAIAVIENVARDQEGIEELFTPRDPSLYDQTNAVMGLPLNSGTDTPETDTSGNGNNATLIGAVLPTYTGIKLSIEQGIAPSNPYNISGIQLHLDADEGFIDNSGNSRTITNNNSVTILASDINGHDSFDIQSVNTQSMQIPNDAAFDFRLTGFTLFAVAKFDSSLGWQGLYGHDNGSGNQDKIIWGTTAQVTKIDLHINTGVYSGEFATSTKSIATANYEIRAFRVNAAMSWDIYELGTLQNSGTFSAAVLPVMTADIFVGWAGEGGSYLDAKLTKYLVYNRDLLDGEMTTILAQLASDYAL